MLGALLFGGIALWFDASAGWVLFWAVLGACGGNSK